MERSPSRERGITLLAPLILTHAWCCSLPSLSRYTGSLPAGRTVSSPQMRKSTEPARDPDGIRTQVFPRQPPMPGMFCFYDEIPNFQTTPLYQAQSSEGHLVALSPQRWGKGSVYRLHCMCSPRGDRSEELRGLSQRTLSLAQPLLSRAGGVALPGQALPSPPVTASPRPVPLS